LKTARRGSFLTTCLECFQVGIWTSATKPYVMDVLWRLLGDPRQFTFIFSRETCFRSEAGASAPMSIAQYPPFGRDLSTQGQI
jgi:hypothetical protein